jgi:hypothetical protein
MGVGTYRGPDKVHKTMSEFKHGTLHSGSKKGPKVQSRKQAIAIALSQQRKENRGRRTKRSQRRR